MVNKTFSTFLGTVDNPISFNDIPKTEEFFNISKDNIHSSNELSENGYLSKRYTFFSYMFCMILPEANSYHLIEAGFCSDTENGKVYLTDLLKVPNEKNPEFKIGQISIPKDEKVFFETPPEFLNKFPNKEELMLINQFRYKDNDNIYLYRRFLNSSELTKQFIREVCELSQQEIEQAEQQGYLAY